MAIENRDLVVEGARLTGRYKKQTFVCAVEKDAEGNLAFAVDGKSFKSPSSAASHVMGGGAVNGWRFWSLEGAAPEATTAPTAANRPKTRAKAEGKAKSAPKAAAKRTTFRLIKRIKDQPSDLEEGQVAYWCSACQRSFVAGAQTPSVCSEGHKTDDPELTSALAPEAVTAEA